MRGRVVLVLCLLITAPSVGTAGALLGPVADGTGLGGEEDGVSARGVLLSMDVWPVPAATERALADQGADVVETFDASNVVLVASSLGAGELASLPHVAYAVEDEALTPHLAESKPLVGVSGELHEAGLTGEGVNVALVDSGVDSDHVGLRDRVVLERFVTEGGVQDGGGEPSEHGTHVAGVLAGTGAGALESRGDVSGVAPGAGLVSLDISQQFTTSNALRAFEWVYQHHGEEEIGVLVNAWGRERAPAEYEPDDPLVRASDALVEDGVVVVFSAGNAGPDPGKMTVEGTNPNVITVGATDKEGRVESYSSRGPVYEDGARADWVKPDVVAPGSRIVSTVVTEGGGGSYGMMNGTSMAAPHVGAAVALLLSVRPDLSPQEVKGVLLEGAEPIGSGVDDESGHGLMDVHVSLEILEASGDRFVERSASYSQAGALTGPPEVRGVLQEASVDDEDAMRVMVPVNGSSLDGSVAWDGVSALEVRVVDPSGSVVERLSVEDGAEASFQVEDPRAGTWRLTFEPEADRGEYEVEVEVAWLEEAEGLGVPMAEEHSSSGSFPSTGSGLSPFASSWVPGVPNVVPMVLGALLSMVMIAGRIRAREG